MCKTSKSTSSTQVPAYVTQFGTNLASDAQNLYDSPPTAPTQQIAGFSGDQSDAFQQVRDLIANAPQVTPQALSDVNQYAGAPGQHVDPASVSYQQSKDQAGPLTNYMSQYVGASLAPTLQTIQDSSDAQKKQLDAGATSAGAFGDARQGVQQALNDKYTQQNMGNATASAYQNAFNNALSAQQYQQGQASGANLANANFNTNAQLANAGFNEQALQRLLGGATNLEGVSTTSQQNALAQIQALLGTGTLQQQQAQAPLTSQYTQQEQTFAEPVTLLNALSTALGAEKGNASTSTTTTQPDNAMLGALGAVSGGLLKNPAVTASIASWL